MFNYFGLGIFVFFVYLLVYSLIDRVCKCVERCAYARAVDKISKKDDDKKE